MVHSPLVPRRGGGGGRRVRRLAPLLALFLAAAVSGAVAGGPRASLWDDEEGNRYSNRKAMHLGDLITVIVTESSEGSNRAVLNTKKESKFEADGGPGEGPLSFIPMFSAKGETSRETKGSGQTSLSGQLSTRITVQVKEIRPNGHLVIEGSRLITINGDEDHITLHGVARPEDIRADNTIYSTYLAEARIAYNGKGPAKGAAGRSLFERILSWIF